MKFNYIIINNFLSFAPEDQRYDFPEKGLIGIMGTKDTDGDSNGSGKSSFLEAIVYALTGKTVKGYKVSEITNRNHKLNPHTVSLSLTKGTGENFIVERGTAGLKLTEIKSGKETIQTKQTKDLTQKYIYDEILNIKFETITSSLACSADQDIPVLKLTNSFKKTVVENLVLGNEIEKLYEKSKKRRSNIQDDVDRIQKQFDEIETTVKSKISSLKAYKEDVDNKKRILNDEIEELDKIDVEKGKAIIKCKSIKAEKEELESSTGKEIQGKESELAKLEEVDIDSIIKQFDIKKEIEDFKVNKESLLHKYEKLSEEAKNKTSILKSLKTELEDKKEKRLKIEINSCYACGQEVDAEKRKEMTDEIDSSISDINEKIKNENDAIDVIKPDYVEAKKNYQNCKIALEKLEESFDGVGEYQERGDLKEIEVQIRNIKEYLDKNKPGYEDGIKKLEEDYIQNKTSKDIRTIEIEGEIDEEKINNVDANIKVKKNELENLRTDTGFSDRLKKETDILMDKYRSKKKELKEKKEELRYYNFIVTSFGNGKECFKNYYFETIIPFVNDKVSELSSRFFNKPVDFSFNRDLEETITINGKESKYKFLSGGEKARMDFSLILTFNHLARFKMKDYINFIFLDEILDGAVDGIGMEKFVEMIKELGEEMLVFVTSHKAAIKETFDDILFFEKIKDDTYIRKSPK